MLPGEAENGVGMNRSVRKAKSVKHNKRIAADCKVHKSDQSPDQKKECRKHRQPNTHMFPRPGDSNTPLGSAELLRNYSRKCVLTWSYRHLTWSYSRTPLIRPPSESHWCGRIRGMVAREGFVYEQKPLSVTGNVVV